MVSTHLKPKSLPFLVGGMIAILLLLASLPVPFQSSSGYGGTRTIALNSDTYQISIRELSNAPDNRTHKVDLDLTNHPAPKGGLRFRIEPL